jgi:tetratricopeptide (TPR) repeat protein
MGMPVVAGAVFVLIAGIGAATTYLAKPPDTTRAEHSSSHDETLARLKDYTHSIGTEAPAPAATPSKSLPDVNTMIERLSARLEASPDDAKGWRMLGWSYFHTERYKEAVVAYARAVALDANSAELKLEFEQAKAKASVANQDR